MSEKKPTKTAEEKSAYLAQLEAAYAKEPNKVLRTVNFHYAKVLTKRPKMTWVEYCDLKIQAFTNHWNAKKTNPNAGKSIKALTPDQEKKARENLQKALDRAKLLEARIKATEELTKKKS